MLSPLITFRSDLHHDVLLIHNIDLAPLLEVLLKSMTEQLKADAADQDSPPSLSGKWAPREGRSHSTLAKALAHRLFPTDKAPRKLYRYANTLRLQHQVEHSLWMSRAIVSGAPVAQRLALASSFLPPPLP